MTLQAHHSFHHATFKQHSKTRLSHCLRLQYYNPTYQEQKAKCNDLISKYSCSKFNRPATIAYNLPVGMYTFTLCATVLNISLAYCTAMESLSVWQIQICSSPCLQTILIRLGPFLPTRVHKKSSNNTNVQPHVNTDTANRSLFNLFEQWQFAFI